MRCLLFRWWTRWRSSRRSAARAATTWSELLATTFNLKLFITTSQVEVICETREDWWTALLTWLRSLGGSKGICDILQHLLDFTNTLIHLVNCSFSSNPDPECPGTFLANQLAWLKEQEVTNTDQLNFASEALLVVVVISVHLALSALILAVLLPFTCNCFSSFGAKVEKVVAMTRRTGSTRRTRSSSRRTRSSSRRAGSIPSGSKLTISSKAQVSPPQT